MDRLSSGPRLVIVCGLPGSGKTTYAKQLEGQLRAVRLCPDEWMDTLSIDLWDERTRARMETLQWQFGRQLLSLGLPVIIEWGTWGKSERDTLRLDAREIGAAVELHYLTASIDVLFARVQNRAMESPSITREQIAHWTAIFEAPTPFEAALFDKFVTVQF